MGGACSAVRATRQAVGVGWWAGGQRHHTKTRRQPHERTTRRMHGRHAEARGRKWCKWKQVPMEAAGAAAVWRGIAPVAPDHTPRLPHQPFAPNSPPKLIVGTRAGAGLKGAVVGALASGALSTTGAASAGVSGASARTRTARRAKRVEERVETRAAGRAATRAEERVASWATIVMVDGCGE